MRRRVGRRRSLCRRSTTEEREREEHGEARGKCSRQRGNMSSFRENFGNRHADARLADAPIPPHHAAINHLQHPTTLKAAVIIPGFLTEGKDFAPLAASLTARWPADRRRAAHIVGLDPASRRPVSPSNPRADRLLREARRSQERRATRFGDWAARYSAYTYSLGDAVGGLQDESRRRSFRRRQRRSGRVSTRRHAVRQLFTGGW